jgi:hypothetical protein
MDATGRLARIEFFTTPQIKDKIAQYDYSDFRQVAGGMWIPCLYRAVLKVAGVESKETSRIDNLSVNQPIPANIFVAEPFFKNVEFVDNFEAIYK